MPDGCPPDRPGPRTSARDLAVVMLVVGFPRSASVIGTGVAIAIAESGLGLTRWYHGSPGRPECSGGVWQINLRAHPQVSPACAQDIVCATRFALSLYRGRGGRWTDWSTYLTGAYRSHLSLGVEAARSALALHGPALRRAYAAAVERARDAVAGGRAVLPPPVFVGGHPVVRLPAPAATVAGESWAPAAREAARLIVRSAERTIHVTRAIRDIMARGRR
jgi:hypothetical protein